MKSRVFLRGQDLTRNLEPGFGCAWNFYKRLCIPTSLASMPGGRYHHVHIEKDIRRKRVDINAHVNKVDQYGSRIHGSPLESTEGCEVLSYLWKKICMLGDIRGFAMRVSVASNKLWGRPRWAEGSHGGHRGVEMLADLEDVHVRRGKSSTATAHGLGAI